MKRQTFSFISEKIGTALVVLGALIVVAGSQMRLNAQLSGQGAYLEIQQAGYSMPIEEQPLLPAAIETARSTGMLAFGMLMMLLGFGFHALIVMRQRDEKPVPVRVRKPQRTSRRQMEVIWVERTIRL